MLSLVAYQSSEESESDSEGTANIETDTLKSRSCENECSELNRKSSNSSLLFAIPSKTKESVKITVPSLKEFEDDEKDEPSSKKFKKSNASGLINMLPPPKYSRPASSQKSFVPYVLTKKPTPSSSHIPGSLPKSNSVELSKKPTTSGKSLVKTEYHFEKEPAAVEKEDNSPVIDFFSLEDPLHSKSECNFPVPVNNKELKSQEQSTQITGSGLQASSVLETSSPSPKNSSASWKSQPENTCVQYSESTSSNKNSAVEASWEGQPLSNTYDGYPEVGTSVKEYTADEGFLRIQGKRKGQEEISIIDVSVDDQLSDKTEWMTKSITEEKVHRPSRKKHDMPTQLQKRKHQITYLAFQAKERELELKNQWSQNRLTKRETQAKYGF